MNGPAPPPSELVRIDPSADVATGALLGPGTIVWHLAQIREHVVMGQECVIGRGAYIGPGVRMGDRCKVQNHALVYEPAELADGVFVGPAVVFTNDLRPRAVTPDGRLKGSTDWEPVGVTVGEGASIGARAVCVAPVKIGSWAMVAAGAVVVADVAPHALVAGVPARQIGWVGRAGHRLEKTGEDHWRCPVTGEGHVPGPDGGLRASPADGASPRNGVPSSTKVPEAREERDD